MPSRASVYAAIDSERDYQDQKWTLPIHLHNETEFLVFIQHYVLQAMYKASTLDFQEVPNRIACLTDIRKIAALAVACMEQNGVVNR